MIEITINGKKIGNTELVSLFEDFLQEETTATETGAIESGRDVYNFLESLNS